MLVTVDSGGSHYFSDREARPPSGRYSIAAFWTVSLIPAGQICIRNISGAQSYNLARIGCSLNCYLLKKQSQCNDRLGELAHNERQGQRHKEKKGTERKLPKQGYIVTPHERGGTLSASLGGSSWLFVAGSRVF